MLSIKRSAYSLLEGGSSPWPPQRSSLVFKALVFLASVVVISLSFALGRWSSSSYSSSRDRERGFTKVPPGLSLQTSPQVFIYNRTFGEKSAVADAAWDILFPKQAGYFSHPELAPQRSTFSVYHYLHCLNGIRQGYWAVYEKAVAGEKLNASSLPMMISPPHVRHCIDLLRQSLMCNPDLTVEVKDEVAGGVHGFGEEHRCIDWSALMGWTQQWESRKGGAAGGGTKNQHNGHAHGDGNMHHHEDAVANRF
ncbi:hypothetical protein QBC47DRAFT_438289 [Echria macrotheca]|uniref:Oxidase ustYa n=1 Tax=Echria macrotheca TaxID=438768 RepID=A0AAJ0BQ12_9PEZI|nr:hypothetical protein QBC47DRAFT_438289 [Echria macrotheca]